jgi:uncharacterized protein DUF6894
MRFFFDYTLGDDAILDYKGQEFRAPGPAIDYGNTLADHLRHALDESWRGWTIAVRDVQGRTVHQLPVGDPEFQVA